PLSTLFHSPPPPPALHSFPTRRSSDLATQPVRLGSTPVGIVYHTTESLIAPFEEDQNRRLRQLGRNVLDVIRKEHAYHYLIDRLDRKSTRLNSSHLVISYAVFCLKKKK